MKPVFSDGIKKHIDKIVIPNKHVEVTEDYIFVYNEDATITIEIENDNIRAVQLPNDKVMFCLESEIMSQFDYSFHLPSAK